MPEYLARYSYVGATYESMTMLPDSERTTSELKFKAVNEIEARKKADEEHPNIAEGAFKAEPVRLDSLVEIGPELSR